MFHILQLYCDSHEYRASMHDVIIISKHISAFDYF